MKSKVLEFYKHAISAQKINDKILSEAKKISNELELKKFMKEKLLPIAQEMGYDLTADDLLTYEKNVSKQLSEEDLENITGGINMNWMIGGLLSLAVLGTIPTAKASAMMTTGGINPQTSQSATVNPQSETTKDDFTRVVKGKGTLKCTQDATSSIWTLSLTREGSQTPEVVTFYAIPKFNKTQFLDETETKLSNDPTFNVNKAIVKNFICPTTAIDTSKHTVQTNNGEIKISPIDNTSPQQYTLTWTNGTSSESANFQPNSNFGNESLFLANVAIAVQLHSDFTVQGFIERNSHVTLMHTVTFPGNQTAISLVAPIDQLDATSRNAAENFFVTLITNDSSDTIAQTRPHVFLTNPNYIPHCTLQGIAHYFATCYEENLFNLQNGSQRAAMLRKTFLLKDYKLESQQEKLISDAVKYARKDFSPSRYGKIKFTGTQTAVSLTAPINQLDDTSCKAAEKFFVTLITNDTDDKDKDVKIARSRPHVLFTHPDYIPHCTLQGIAYYFATCYEENLFNLQNGSQRAAMLREKFLLKNYTHEKLISDAVTYARKNFNSSHYIHAVPVATHPTEKQTQTTKPAQSPAAQSQTQATKPVQSPAAQSQTQTTKPAQSPTTQSQNIRSVQPQTSVSKAMQSSNTVSAHPQSSVSALASRYDRGKLINVPKEATCIVLPFGKPKLWNETLEVIRRHKANVGTATTVDELSREFLNTRHELFEKTGSIGLKDPSYTMVKDALLMGTGMKLTRLSNGETIGEGNTESVRAFILGVFDLLEEMEESFERNPQIPCLTQNCNDITLTREQCASIIAGGIMGIMSANQYTGEFDFGVQMNRGPEFGQLFPGAVHYLHRFITAKDTGKPFQGKVRIRRPWGTVLTPADMNHPLCKVKLHTGKIDEPEFSTDIQSDFANASIGGGVLGRKGCVQEEIRFGMVSPECLVSLFLAKNNPMGEMETICIEGVETFSSYSGYGKTTRWNGDVQDKTKRAEDGSIQSCVVAMDAMNKPGVREYMPIGFNREMNKAFTAFSFLPDLRGKNVSTGLWGCGDFSCSIELKFLQQWIACSCCPGSENRTMNYSCYLNKEAAELCDGIIQWVNACEITDAATLYQITMDYCNFMTENFGNVIMTYPQFWRYLAERFGFVEREQCLTKEELQIVEAQKRAEAEARTRAHAQAQSQVRAQTAIPQFVPPISMQSTGSSYQSPLQQQRLQELQQIRRDSNIQAALTQLGVSPAYNIFVRYGDNRIAFNLSGDPFAIVEISATELQVWNLRLDVQETINQGSADIQIYEYDPMTRTITLRRQSSRSPVPSNWGGDIMQPTYPSASVTSFIDSTKAEEQKRHYKNRNELLDLITPENVKNFNDIDWPVDEDLNLVFFRIAGQSTAYNIKGNGYFAVIPSFNNIYNRIDLTNPAAPAELTSNVVVYEYNPKTHTVTLVYSPA